MNNYKDTILPISYTGPTTSEMMKDASGDREIYLYADTTGIKRSVQEMRHNLGFIVPYRFLEESEVTKELLESYIIGVHPVDDGYVFTSNIYEMSEKNGAEFALNVGDDFYSIYDLSTKTKKDISALLV